MLFFRPNSENAFESLKMCFYAALHIYHVQWVRCEVKETNKKRIERVRNIRKIYKKKTHFTLVSKSLKNLPLEPVKKNICSVCVMMLKKLSTPLLFEKKNLLLVSVRCPMVCSPCLWSKKIHLYCEKEARIYIYRREAAKKKGKKSAFSERSPSPCLGRWEILVDNTSEIRTRGNSSKSYTPKKTTAECRWEKMWRKNARLSWFEYRIGNCWRFFSVPCHFFLVVVLREGGWKVWNRARVLEESWKKTHIASWKKIKLDINWREKKTISSCIFLCIYCEKRTNFFFHLQFSTDSRFSSMREHTTHSTAKKKQRRRRWDRGEKKYLIIKSAQGGVKGEERESLSHACYYCWWCWTHISHFSRGSKKRVFFNILAPIKYSLQQQTTEQPSQWCVWNAK